MISDFTTAGALLGAALVALPFSAGLLLVKAVHLVLTRRAFFSRLRGGPGRGIELMALGLSAGLLACVGGFFIGLDPGGDRAACAKAAGNPMRDEGPRGEVRLVEHMLPLSRECRWGDGTHLQLVPLWINIVIFAAIAATLAGVTLLTRVAAARTGLPSRRGLRASP
ncbi:MULTISPECIES: hypothetical protein [unclassified Streptomyces]|uniref:hypothetical protein n=1 Tax=unclassified Streptomyces TaxID=2593676 RepID=UPI002E27D4ED|nr:hypothetical protein [Streptomyces sp. NBC_00223]